VELNFFTRRKILKATNALDLIPVRKSNFETEEGGIIALLIPKFRNEKIANFMLGKRSRNIRILLDNTGSAVWLEIDGIKDIRAICETLKSRNGDDFPQAEQRVCKFISRLYEERYITFMQLENARLKK
jgi:hypothetical protein